MPSHGVKKGLWLSHDILAPLLRYPLMSPFHSCASWGLMLWAYWGTRRSLSNQWWRNNLELLWTNWSRIGRGRIHILFQVCWWSLGTLHYSHPYTLFRHVCFYHPSALRYVSYPCRRSCSRWIGHGWGGVFGEGSNKSPRWGGYTLNKDPISTKRWKCWITHYFILVRNGSTVNWWTALVVLFLEYALALGFSYLQKR